jgi:heme exporter protein D
MGRYTLGEIAPLAWALAAMAALAVAVLYVTTVNRYAELAMRQSAKCAAQIEKALTEK